MFPSRSLSNWFLKASGSPLAGSFSCLRSPSRERSHRWGRERTHFFPEKTRNNPDRDFITVATNPLEESFCDFPTLNLLSPRRATFPSFDWKRSHCSGRERSHFFRPTSDRASLVDRETSEEGSTDPPRVVNWRWRGGGFGSAPSLEPAGRSSTPRFVGEPVPSDERGRSWPDE